MNHLFNFFLFFLFPISVLFGQTNPSESNVPVESNDTVIIQKVPVVVRKVLYIEEEVKPSNKYIEVFASSFENTNYYKVCEDCKEYLTRLKETTKPTLGYSAGANFIFMKKHLFASTGASYTTVRETFNYPGTTKSINDFNYLDVNLTGGYRIKKNGLSVIMSGGPVMSYLLSLKGNTISEADTISMVDLTSQHQFRKTSYSLALGIKFVYELSYKLSFFVEPFYRGNITSITQKKELYVVQRNFMGGKLGFVYAF
jgi:hypothetical protein